MTVHPPHRAIALEPEKCTSCMICVRECPVWCIELTADKVHDPDAGPRGRSSLVLQTFTIDYAVCMDCGICVDACPTDALSWVPSSIAAKAAPQDLVLGMAALEGLAAQGLVAQPAAEAGRPIGS